jgi:phosphopantothenoylcysteine decarboxylase/phosphopantothenate--cysteine ligase
MLANPVVQDNIKKLRQYGYEVMESGIGELACKTSGAGRLPDIPVIMDALESLLTPKDYEGEEVLVTAGPTQEPLDPVRYITNLSSGKMGYALATAARHRGASVTLISGPCAMPAPPGVKIINVRTALEMHEAVMKNFTKATVIVKAAAVADYRPESVSEEKIKKSKGLAGIRLVPNPDIIAEIGAKKTRGILVGFAMETQELLANARLKLARKKMDMIVANSLREEGAGFGTDTNIVTIIDSNGKEIRLDKMTKSQVAHRILDHVKTLKKKKGPAKRK